MITEDSRLVYRYWLSSSGRAVLCDDHEFAARAELQVPPLPRSLLLQNMYQRGWIKVTVDPTVIWVYSNQQPAKSQIDWLLDKSAQHKLPVVDGDTGREMFLRD
jgi:hypothetical protein